MNTFKNMVTMAALVAVTATSTVFAGDAVQTGRKILKEKSPSIINVAITSKTKAGGAMAARLGGQLDNEKSVEIVATVIDPSGLAIASLSAVKPSSAMPAIKLGNGQGSLTFTDEVSAVKYILEDGTEIAAKIVLEDKELDLAFIGPEAALTAEQKKLIKPLSLSKAKGPAMQALDTLISISRLGKEFRRAASVKMSKIATVVTKPRTFYFPGNSPGAPAFDLSGNLVGFSLVKPAKKAAQSPMMGMQMPAMTTIIRTLEDILPLVPQAKKAMNEKPE